MRQLIRDIVCAGGSFAFHIVIDAPRPLAGRAQFRQDAVSPFGSQDMRTWIAKRSSDTAPRTSFRLFYPANHSSALCVMFVRALQLCQWSRLEPENSMRISCMRPTIAIFFFLTLVLAACAQPVVLPATGSQTPAVAAAAPDTGILAAQLAADYGIAGDSARGVSVKQIIEADGEPLFVAFTIGLPPEDDNFAHKVSLHAPAQDGWTELGRSELQCVSYLEESWLEQVEIEPDGVWLIVKGGTGAHGACLELLRWDGQGLQVNFTGFSSSPDAGSLVDLNGDGQLDLRIDNSDPYVFCYACGVSQYWAQLFFWDGQSFVEVVPTPLSDEYGEELRDLNNRAVELAQASLFADALTRIEQAQAMAPEDDTVDWNAIWIRHHLEASRREAARSEFPILGHVFAGDWEAALDSLWAIGLPTIASSAPIPEEFVAVSSEFVVGEFLNQYADTAKALQPERAAVHALRAWGRFLVNQDDPAVQEGFRWAAELAPEDERYSEMAAAFEGRTETAPVAATVVPPPNVEALAEQLAEAYGIVQDPARNVAARKLENGDQFPVFVAFTYGLPPDDDSYMHKVSIHATEAGLWSELARVELACVNYLDEYSLEQVEIDPENVWLFVQGGAGAHGGCIELLRWDGEDLQVAISSFSTISDAGSAVDLNGDGQQDVLLNNSDPYIFCYACGIQLYNARFFTWDGQALVEAAPRSLVESQSEELRALNDEALALAEAGLYTDALTQIERAREMAPDNGTVDWNAAWIRHHLEVSRQLAQASPFPLLSHVFAGDWDSAFDALWAIGPPRFLSDIPIPGDSAAFGFGETVGAILVQYAQNALTLRPERAEIHALKAWGHYLLAKTDPAVSSGFRRAAELAPGDPRFAQIVASFGDEHGGNNGE